MPQGLKASLSLAGNTNPTRISVSNVSRCCQVEIVALGNYLNAQNSQQCDKSVASQTLKKEPITYFSRHCALSLQKNKCELKFELG